MRLRFATPFALALLATAPACIALDGCEELTLDGAAGGGSSTGTPSTTSAQGTAGPGSGTGGTGGAGEGAGSSTTESGPGGSGSTGSGGEGGTCAPTADVEMCGNAVDEDCAGGASPCPSGDWWEWIEATAPPDGVQWIEPFGDGVLVAGRLDAATCYAERRAAGGAVVWQRTWTVAPLGFPLFISGAGPLRVVVVGSAFGEITFDDEQTAGAEGEAVGFLRTIDPETGAWRADELQVLEPAGGSATITAMTVLDLDLVRRVVVAGVTDAGLVGPQSTIDEPNGFVAVFDDGLTFHDLVPILDSVGAGSVYPTAVAATATRTIVAAQVEGAIDPLGAATYPGPADHVGTMLQTHHFVDNLQHLAAGPFHSIVSDGDGTDSIDALALEAGDRLHVGFTTDDPGGLLRYDGSDVVTASDATVYWRFGDSGAIEHVDLLGTGLAAIGSLRVVDEGGAVVWSGFAAAGASFLGEDVDGAFVAEMKTDAGIAPVVRWTLGLGAGGSSEPLRVALDPSDPDRRFFAAGFLEGANPIDDMTAETAGRVAFVARLGR